MRMHFISGVNCISYLGITFLEHMVEGAQVDSKVSMADKANKLVCMKAKRVYTGSRVYMANTVGTCNQN